NRRRVFSTVRGLYGAVARYEAGATVTLRVRSADGKDKDPVRLTLGSGLDERSQALLLGLGAAHPFPLAGLAGATEVLSPLPGLSLKQAPVVVSVKEDSPASKVLSPDDVLEGRLDDKGRLWPFASAFDFYIDMGLVRPG